LNFIKFQMHTVPYPGFICTKKRKNLISNKTKRKILKKTVCLLISPKISLNLLYLNINLALNLLIKYIVLKKIL
jgi:hypothetical protein